jgi:cysteine sulfinate desulfinase/cysteine desulfurase-like protein
LSDAASYLDYNASMPIAPEVVSVIRDAIVGAFGNPVCLPATQ